MFTKFYCKMLSTKTAFMNRMREEKGSHTVEIVIFIAIAIGLIVIFGNKIGELMDKIFKTGEKVVTDATNVTVDLPGGGH